MLSGCCLQLIVRHRFVANYVDEIVFFNVVAVVVSSTSAIIDIVVLAIGSSVPIPDLMACLGATQSIILLLCPLGGLPRGHDVLLLLVLMW